MRPIQAVAYKLQCRKRSLLQDREKIDYQGMFRTQAEDNELGLELISEEVEGWA